MLIPTIKRFALLLIVFCNPIFVSLVQGQTASPAMQSALALIEEKKWEEAARAFETITKSEPSNGRAWYNLGVARHSLGQYEKAVEAYLKVPALNSSSLVMYNLACSYARLKDKDKAFEWLMKAANMGLPQIETLKIDEDIAGLRDDARFKTLLETAARVSTPCMVLPEHQQFNFWVGEWDVMNPQGQLAGTNSIQRIVDGCIIFENWTGSRRGTGKSFNFYDANMSKWRQIWVSSNGSTLDLAGNYKDGAMRYEGITVASDGKKTLQRLTFFNLSQDRVRQLWEQSTDDGKTWTIVFDGLYVRKK